MMECSTNNFTLMTKKRSSVCTNCGKMGHEFKTCKDAITSFGIINIQIPNHPDETLMIKNKFSAQKSFYLKIASHKYTNIECYLRTTKNKQNETVIYNINNDGIVCSCEETLKKFSYYRDKIKFLMISRKFSLGFIEFLRGKYDIMDPNTIANLFQQMTDDEITMIKSNAYDDILYKFLNRNNEPKESVLNKIYESKYSAEYCEAKIKFNMLTNVPNDIKAIIPWDMNFYVQNVKPKWKGPEWGFPKGRRDKRYEENLSCACREFEEETGMSSSDYVILNKVEPIEENLIGTNGVSYKHVYYLSLSNDDPEFNFGTYDDHEIGSIRWFTYDEAINCIRPYHRDKQCVLTKVYLFILNQLMANN